MVVLHIFISNGPLTWAQDWRTWVEKSQVYPLKFGRAIAQLHKDHLKSDVWFSDIKQKWNLKQCNMEICWTLGRKALEQNLPKLPGRSNCHSSGSYGRKGWQPGLEGKSDDHIIYWNSVSFSIHQNSLTLLTIHPKSTRTLRLRMVGDMPPWHPSKIFWSRRWGRETLGRCFRVAWTCSSLQLIHVPSSFVGHKMLNIICGKLGPLRTHLNSLLVAHHCSLI